MKKKFFGSDNSYDLLVELVKSEDKGVIELHCLNSNIKEQCIQNIKLIKEHFAHKVSLIVNYKLKITVFNKLPLYFVWLARVEAAIDTIAHMENDLL